MSESDGQSEGATYKVACDYCGVDESFDSLPAAVEAVEKHRSEMGCHFPVDTDIIPSGTDTDDTGGDHAE